MRKAKAAAAPAGDDGPSKAWLDSYADAMTLLLAFFVLLYAFSLLDEKKFAEFEAWWTTFPKGKGRSGKSNKSNNNENGNGG